MHYIYKTAVNESTVFSSKQYPPAKVRQYREQGELLPGLRFRLVVDHEGVEVVRDVADADIDLVG